VVVSLLRLLPWQDGVLREALGRLTSSAGLIHGHPGCGQLELALALAKAWLCESPESVAAATAVPACGRCPACHLVDTGYHPDLKVLVPEALRGSLGWDFGADEGDADKGEAKKRKPSQEIKVDAVREAVAFCQSTVSRDRAKVVLIHPAERMNTVSANTLLKTLEEPPGSVRFLLSCGAIDDILPTVRSRCQAWHLPLPEPAAVLDWLCTSHQGLSPADAGMVLAAAGGSPQGAAELLALGWTAAAWQRLPTDVAQGVAGAWAGWPLPLLIDALQKLCHDLARVGVGGSARFFPAQAVPAGAHLPRVTAWAAELRQARRHADHPWNAGLKVESLLFQARRAVQPDAPRARG
jgi:DNA polymerase-3 subunit delta'